MPRFRFVTSVFVGALLVSVPAYAVAETLRVPLDFKSIQAAIDAASAGDIVLVKAGTYKERVRLKPEITLKSDGDNAQEKLGLKRATLTIIDGGGIAGKGAGVTMAQGSTLDGFTVTNVGEYDDDAWKEHHTTQGEHQSHEHIGEPGTAGISAIGVRCTITNNIVHHIGYSGIAIQGMAGKPCSPHVYRNICYRNMGGGIGVMKKSTAVIEENICFENFYAGIGHDDASPTVIRNICYENIRAGIGISHGACPRVQGNKCYKNRRAGIGIREGSNTRPVIEDNDCYENEMAGIGTRQHAAPIIRNNRCYKNKLAGIGSQTHATPTITGNECYENGESGIGQMSDAVTVLIGNYCHHNKAAGISFASCNAGKCTMKDNRVIDNERVAVGINAGWSVQLSGNEFSRKEGLPPIVMVFRGAEATFTENTLRGGGVAGLRVAGKVRANNNEFAGTMLRKAGPPNFAVWALPGSSVTMSGNKIHGWRHALHASEADISATNNTVSEFHRAAFVVQKSKNPPNIFGNTAHTMNSKDKVVLLDGEEGIVKDNELKLESSR